jgi:quercetin dioxygenase-like cupin family protein
MKNFINSLNIFSKIKNIHNIRKIFYTHDIDFQKYYINNPINYEKKVLYKNKDYELVLINWEKGSFTNLHNHPANGCVLKVLDGKLYEINDKKSPLILNKSDTNYKLRNDYHMIIALEKSYSLHYYSPPNYYN